MAVHGQVWDEKADDGTGSNQVNSLLKSLETESAGTLPMIRPGDASVAAPFTSRCNVYFTILYITPSSVHHTNTNYHTYTLSYPLIIIHTLY